MDAESGKYEMTIEHVDDDNDEDDDDDDDDHERICGPGVILWLG